MEHGDDGASRLRLGVYADLSYRRDGERVSTTTAFVSWLSQLAEDVDQLVLFGRVDPVPGRSPFELPASSRVRFVEMRFYPSLHDLRAVTRAVLPSWRRWHRELSSCDALLVFGPYPLSTLCELDARASRIPVFVGVRETLSGYVQDPAVRRVAMRSWAPRTAVAAIVVNYESGQALLRCVDSLRREGVEQVVVVDNGSVDGSFRELLAHDPSVIGIEPGRNLGYGGAVNLGVGAVQAESLLVCNPDVALRPGSLERLTSYLHDHPDVAVVGPKLVDAEGRQRMSARHFPTVSRSWRQAFLGLLCPSGRRAREYARDNWHLPDGGEVDWVTGACLLVRASAFTEVDGFDTAYFMYVEEADLCWRLRRLGWGTAFEPSATAVHVGGVSTRSRPYKMTLEHHRSLWRFARKTADGPELLALPIVAVGLAARCLLALARQRLRPDAHVSAHGGRRPT